MLRQGAERGGVKQTYVLQPAPHPSRQRAIDAVGMAPDGVVVTIKEARKSREQEERYHAMFGDIARQVPVNGVRLDQESMKRVLVSAFKIDTKDDPDLRDYWKQVSDVPMVVGMRGEIVILGDQTRRFPKPLASALIEWLFALGAEHDVRWTDPAERRAA